VSTPVTVRVTTPPNLPPVINLVQPTNGAAFLAPASIAMVANAYDPDGQIVLVEFFADATLLGAWDPLTVPPPEGGLPLSPQLLWTNVPAGDYLLTARATDELGATTVSAPVSIQVNVPAGRPVVNVAAIDRLAVEATNDFGAFAITRKGDPTLPLTVYYSLSGTASNGVDYVALPGSVTILAGELTAQITIEAITDDVVEGLERVILTLVAPDCNGLKPVECYQVGVSNTAAVVVISDPLEFPPLPGAYGQGLPKDGMGPSAVTAALPARIYELVNRPSGRCQMTIISQPGQMITIEVSDDLFEWKPLTTLVNTDGVLEFSDPTAGHFNRSFYRIVVGQ
jgi:hypothetical protein